MSIIREELTKKLEEINKLEEQIASELEGLPQGRLRISNSRGKPTYFFKKEDNKEQYLKKSR